MLDKLKEDLICELKDVSKDGVKTGNIEYISKLAETYKNLNKSEKEELESMIYDERLDRRDRRYGRDYDSRYGARGRGEYARRDSRGRYADGFRPIEDGYEEYMGSKRRYRDGASPKEDLYDGLEVMMNHLCRLMEDVYHDTDSEEERKILEKYFRKMAEIR